MAQTSGYFQNYDATARPSQINGMDIYHGQLDNPHNFVSAYAAGARFVIFKAGGMISTTFTARYIRCTVNGSHTNSSSIFTEVEVWKPVSGTSTNIALGKTVTGSVATPQVGSYSFATDGSLNYTTNLLIVGDNTQYIQVDLGSVQSGITNVVIWHYPGRIFKNNKIEYSSDGTTWTTLFDSATSGEYLEILHPATNAFIGFDCIKGANSTFWLPDTTFNAVNVASARAAGLKVGAYFFKNPNYCFNGNLLNSAGDGSSQASVFWQYITSAMGLVDWTDIMVWLDWENNDGHTIYPSTDNDGSYNYIKAFCDTIKLKSSGRQCGVYTAWFCLDGQTAVTANTLVHSTNGTMASVCPLWYSQIVDAPYGSSYPNRYGWNQGQFGGWTAWTLWQFSYSNNNSAARFGFAAGDLDLDICEGSLVNVMPPTFVTSIAGTGASTSIHLNWGTGETDVRGYMYTISGQATATVGTGIGSATIVGLLSNTSYPIQMTAYDMWETGVTTGITVNTAGATGGSFGTLLCFKL